MPPTPPAQPPVPPTPPAPTQESDDDDDEHFSTILLCSFISTVFIIDLLDPVLYAPSVLQSL